MHSKFMDSCEKVAEKASLYRDGQLSLGQRVKMRMHLMMCHQCRKFMDQFDLTVHAFRKLGAEEQVSERQVDDQLGHILRNRPDKD